MDSDRNLLFGVLAFQADLVGADQFAKACALWAADKAQPLADVLVSQGWLTPGDRADIGRLLERKLRKHGGDARASLIEVTTDAVRRTLAPVPDADIHASLQGPSAIAGHVLFATADYAPEVRDRYTLTRLHATGGIGRVWLARDLGMGRNVALKELRPERAGVPAVGARFLREARVTCQLEHPGIVPVYEVGRRPEDQSPFYTMRFVRGQTLRDRVADYHGRRAKRGTNPLELRDLLAAFLGVCNAVAFAHSKGVIHRDLKPQNVVLGDFGEVMVLDWGLAKVVGAAEDATPPSIDFGDEEPADRTVAGQVLGTPAYMAPEQAEGRLDQLDARTDVYGLGAILYEILTGRPPFAGAETAEILRKVTHEPPEKPRTIVRSVPPALEAVCLKAVAKQPDQRYPGAEDLANDVRHWLADEPVSALRDRWGDRAFRWARRNRSWTWAAAVTLVLVAVMASLAVVLIYRAHLGEVDARTEADVRRREAEKSLRQANKNLRTAQDVVRDSFHQIAASELSAVPEADRVRMQLAKVALTYNEKFLAENSDNPAVRWDAGDIFRTMGSLYSGANQPDDSLAFYNRSLAEFRSLVSDSLDPAKPEYKSNSLAYRMMLAKVCRETGAMLRGRGRHAEARPLFEEGLGQLAQPADDYVTPSLRAAWSADSLDFQSAPGLTEWEKWLLKPLLRVRGQLLVEFARLHQDEGRVADALVVYDRTAAFFRASLRSVEANTPFRQATVEGYIKYSRPEMDHWYLCWALRGRAAALTALGRAAEADETYAEAVRLLTGKTRPDDRYLLASILVSRGADRSPADLDAGIGLLEPLARDFRYPSYRREYARALIARARLRPDGERARAEVEHGKARDLADGLVAESGGKPAADDLANLADALAGLARLGGPAAPEFRRQVVARYEEALAVCPAHAAYRRKLDEARKTAAQER